MSQTPSTLQLPEDKAMSDVFSVVFPVTSVCLAQSGRLTDGRPPVRLCVLFIPLVGRGVDYRLRSWSLLAPSRRLR